MNLRNPHIGEGVMEPNEPKASEPVEVAPGDYFEGFTGSKGIPDWIHWYELLLEDE